MLTLALLVVSLAPCDPDRLPVSLEDVRAFTGHGIDKETAYQLWTLSFRHREVMEACVRGNNGADVAAAWAAECHWRSTAWSLLDDVLRCYQDEPTQIRKLRELMKLIGPEAYYAGAMPMPVPTYRTLD